MKYCTRCGTQNTDEAQVCVHCQSYLSPVIVNSKKSPSFYINALGIINGILSVVLGIITFSFSFLSQDTIYMIKDEYGLYYEQFIDLFFSSTKALSFGLGSLLVVLGLFLILYFANKTTQKGKQSNSIH